ncbi:hypothetical protein AAL_03784 [Moelleriella libera RCEF 2490]|uniref:Uncharacterized protein n=1 Tax=Moelleriella libera RCEF 2490 TaxID=1081109 RepID=A0A168CG46_9HYPO|nr:hypothetical protein AAL_03784 [Moelleriella libera RCEF 2490]
MHALTVLLACLATVALAAPTPVRDQLSGPPRYRNGRRADEAAVPKADRKFSLDNGVAPHQW